MKPRFGKPYLYATWLSPLLAGSASCQAAVWTKAHFFYDKRRSDFDFTAWRIAHTAMLEKRAAELRADGWTVTTEDQNAFKLNGKVAILSGKPDLVSRLGDDVLISDLKSGQRRDSDVVQVLLYLFALPLVLTQLRSQRLAGEVVYVDGTVPVTMDLLTADVRARILAVIDTVAGETSPPKVPAFRECSFCDLAACQERIKVDPAMVETTAF